MPTSIRIASLTPLAVGIAMVYREAGLAALAIDLVPLVLARYSFILYAHSMEDVEKANADLKEANERQNCGCVSASRWRRGRKMPIPVQVSSSKQIAPAIGPRPWEGELP